MALDKVLLMFAGRWHRLLASADALSELPRSANRLEACLAHLDTVLELFPKGVDPIDDEEGFAVRAFARALHAHLSAMVPGARR